MPLETCGDGENRMDRFFGIKSIRTGRGPERIFIEHIPERKVRAPVLVTVTDRRVHDAIAAQLDLPYIADWTAEPFPDKSIARTEREPAEPALRRRPLSPE